MAEQDHMDLYRRFENLKGIEQHKDDLISEILRRLRKATEDYQQEALDHARESQYNRDGQKREHKLQNEIRKCKAEMERDPFVLVLIDGDGMIFADQFLKKGETGGKEASASLGTAIRENLLQRIASLPADYKIVTRIYANLKGLGDVCYRAGILERASLIEDFARGFTGSKQLFDFVDVGMGKDRADEKISEIFKFHLYDYHCRHIFFGCSHDNGYARLLEDVSDHPIENHITLLEGVPFERELTNLKSKYNTTKFEGLFRTAKVSVYQQFPSHIVGPQPTPSPAASQTQYQSPYQPAPMSRTSPALSSASPMNPTATSWASTAIANATRMASPPLTPHTTPPAPTIKTIARNRHGQRIDPPAKFDANEVERVKKIKMCNIHFLRQDCLFGDGCTHDHSYKPNNNEVQTLRYVARMTPCKFGTECDDIKCIYGHRCPVSEPSGKSCKFGMGCRFTKDMHVVDLTIVKTMKVGGK